MLLRDVHLFLTYKQADLQHINNEVLVVKSDQVKGLQNGNLKSNSNYFM